MDEVLNLFYFSEIQTLSLAHIAAGLSLSFVLSVIIASFYKKAEKSTIFTRDFAMSLILFACVTSVLTMVIGNNVARAFGLVGALSIIRFRTAIKSSLDVVYLLWALMIGMACGVGFYVLSIAVTFLIMVFLLIAQNLKWLRIETKVLLLKISALTSNESLTEKLAQLFKVSPQHIEILSSYGGESGAPLNFVVNITHESTREKCNSHIQNLTADKDISNLEVLSSI